jgi:tyrosine-protein kinase Etk/Wzc
MKSERIQRQPILPHGGAPQMRGSDGDDEIDLMDLAAQVLARKWLVLFCTAIFAGIGAVIGQLPPNLYRAAALVQIENRQNGIGLPAELIGELLMGETERRGTFRADSHVIQSRLILDPAAQALRLDLEVSPVMVPVIGDLLRRYSIPAIDELIPPRYARGTEELVLGELFPPPGMDSEDTITLEVLAGGQVRLSLPDGQQVVGPAPGQLDLPGGGLVVIETLEAAPGREFTLRRRALIEAAKFIRDGLSVRERTDTGIVDFTFSGTAPEDAVAIVNAVIASYEEQNLRRRAAEVDQSIAFIEGQVPEVRAALNAAAEELRLFQRDRQIEQLSRTTQDTLARMVQIETRLEELNFRKDQALQRVTENHPEFRALVVEEDLLRSRLSALRDDLADVPETERELAALTAQLERNRQLEIQLATRIEQLRALRASTVSTIRILERAEIAPKVGPNRLLPIAIGGAVGLILTILGVLGANALRRGIEDERTIEELGLSLFASIEKVPGLAGARSADPNYGLVLAQPQSPIAESLRGLRTGLRFSLATAQQKSLMITSCAPADGKSFISLNLALVSGQAGARVLLIDADMRRGVLRNYFGLPRKTPGLSDLLSTNADLESVVFEHPASGIHFIATGSYPPNPAELLASPQLSRLLASVDPHYDLIIIDAPPALAVTDPGIIGQHAGMSLIVVRHAITTPDELTGAMKLLENSGVSLSGAILNQLDRRSSRYGGYGYYRSGYKYTYDTRKDG